MEPEVGLQLHLVLSVDDAYECKNGESRHELRCKRDDVHLLGSAASGVLDDLNRVTKAVAALRSVLDTQKKAVSMEDPSLLKQLQNTVRFNVVRPARVVPMH